MLGLSESDVLTPSSEVRTYQHRNQVFTTGGNVPSANAPGFVPYTSHSPGPQSIRQLTQDLALAR